jgi:hypothetical protein
LGSNVGTLLLAQGKPGVFPEATMPCPILRRNLPMAARSPDAAKRNPGTIAPAGRLIPVCAEPVIGRAFARPVGSTRATASTK